MSVVYQSQMNPSLVLTRGMWAISMVIENKPFSMHTMLIIETIEESGRRNFKAHLMGPGTLIDKRVKKLDRKDPKTSCYCWSTVGKVDITPLRESLDPNRYRPKFRTWLVEREKAQQMMDRIRDEKDHPEKVDRPFHIFGEKSIFSRERVQFDITDQQLIEMQEKDPKGFEKLSVLCSLRRSNNIPESKFKEEKISMKFPFTKALLAWPCLSGKLVDAMIERPPVVQHTVSIFGGIVLLPIDIITLPLLIMGALTIDSPHFMVKCSKIKKNTELLDRFEKHVRKVQFVSQNCFNWARNQLTSIGITVGERPCERLLCIPTLYLSDKSRVTPESRYPLDPASGYFTAGNCLFDAVALCMPSDPPHNAATLREAAITAIRANPELQADIVRGIGEGREALRVFNAETGTIEDQPYVSFDDYLAKMSQDRTWATEIEIRALARHLRRPIYAITEEHRYDQVYEGDLETDPIFLDYDGGHFRALVPRVGENPRGIAARISEDIAARGVATTRVESAAAAATGTS